MRPSAKCLGVSPSSKIWLCLASWRYKMVTKDSESVCEFKKVGDQMKKQTVLYVLLVTMLADYSFTAQKNPNQCEANGEWCAEINGVGKLALKFGSHVPNRCELYWLFASISVPVRKEADVMILGSASNDVNSLRMTLNGEGQLHFLPNGILCDRYWAAYQGITFERLSSGGFEDIASYMRKGSEYNKFNKAGQLQDVPPSFPGWLMNVSAYLFMDDDHTLPVLLKHPALEASTLAFLAEHLAKKPGTARQLARIAAHTNTPLSTLDFLFERPVVPLVWHSVARNPRSRPEMKNMYLEKVKKGDTKTLWQTVRDPDCPPELLVWIYDQTKDRFLRNEVICHTNMPAWKLKLILAEQPFDETRKSLASNSSLPDDLMSLVIQTTDKQTLWAAQRNPHISTQSLDGVLHRLATHSEILVHDSALLDNRITPPIVAILMQEVDQRNRMILARNTALTFDDLCTLAKDPYRIVSSEARKQLQNRFPEKAPNILSRLPDLSLLNEADDKGNELQLGIKNKDLPAIDRCGQYFAHHDALQPSYSQTFGEALKSGDPVVMSALLLHFPVFPFEQSIREGAMTRSWLDYLYERGLVEKNQLSILVSCIQNNKSDLFDYLLKKGLNVNAKDDNGRTLLVHALKMRSLQTVEKLLACGADPFIADNQGLLAVDYAARGYLLSIVKKLDATGKYRAFLDNFARSFPAEKASPLLGIWNNKKDGFSYGGLVFYDDGTGILVTSIMPILVAWRCPSAGKIEVQVIAENGPNPRERTILLFQISGDVLTLGEQGNKEKGVYYRVKK